MKRTRFAEMAVLMIVSVVIAGAWIAQAQEKCSPIYIRSHEGLEPPSSQVNKGDCVVWINWTRGEDVKVIFREGKKCAEVTQAPVGFKADFSGCYLTNYLGFGETSSLIFVEPGKYDYDIEFRKTGGGLYGEGRTTSPILSGSITVK